MQRCSFAIVLFAVVAGISPAGVAQERDRKFDAASIRFFEQQIRPLLVEKCFECHGAEKQESGLRLDSRSAILKGSAEGPVVVARKPDQSRLFDAIRPGGDVQMPPDSPLSAEEIKVFESWIRRGLPWPESDGHAAGANAATQSHWAFQQVGDIRIPDVDDDKWSRTAVDRFILRKLSDSGLAPASLADRRTLIRRASFDLLGLPPLPQDVDNFIANSGPDAFDRLTDRLLASPHYGERWGRHWLDIARYADNKGYVFFEEKNFPWAWTYRDWVIQALNDDLPYDRFVVEQLAADQIHDGNDTGHLAAMGFLTVGARFMNNSHDVIDDRIDVTTRGLMGLTVTCARCHDHKYDPVPQDDYYSLYGVFRSSFEPVVPPALSRAGDAENSESFEKGMQERLAKLDDFLEKQRSLLSQDARNRAAEYLLAVHRKRNQPATENFMLLTEKGKLTPWMVHRWEQYLKRTRRTRDPVWTVWHRYSELPDNGFAAGAARVHRELFRRTDSPRPNINSLVARAFEQKVPMSMDEVARTYAELLNRIESEWSTLARRIDDSNGAIPARFQDPDRETIRQVYHGHDAPPVIPRQLGWGFLDLLPDRPTQDEFKKLLKEVEKWSTTGPGAPARAMVLHDTEAPYEPVVFVRGNPNRHGRPVPRRAPAAVVGRARAEFESGSGRLELARAVIDPANPLTARVFVNRIWQHHFGTGIVDTPSDFGLRSSSPSHPRLLNWLARHFVANGWAVKRLHRLIMSSSVYQQDGTPSVSLSHARRADSENRLLWKFPRQRLGYEAMRDSLLAVSGRLDTRLGGSPVDGLNSDESRRTVYGFVNRMDLPGTMRAFDFPDPAASSPGREQTTVAPQALYFLNHDFVFRCARELVRRPDVSSHANVGQRVGRIHRLLFGRSPGDDERLLADEWFASSATTISPPAWKYGYGAVDEQTQQVSTFKELTYWTGTRWQAGPKLPDAKLGWVFHDRTGGHPASSSDRCYIRRWTAPESATVRIAGTLRHHPEEGNGIRARIVCRRQGVVGEWKADQSSAETIVEDVSVQTGDTIDFVVDWQNHITHDEFEWPVTIRQVGENAREWDSRKEFSGDESDAWTDYVHALMMTNEFVFVD